MKGIIFDIRRFAVHDGPGIRTTVFFKGCTLSCRWCHNPESIDTTPFTFHKRIKLDDRWFENEEMVGMTYTVAEVMKMVLSDRIFFEESGGGVTFSGGEPLLQPEFLAELLKACRKEGLHTTVDTSGHVLRRYIDFILPYTNLILYDLKHHDPIKHKQSTGFTNELILSNLKDLVKNKVPLRVRIPVIPFFNHNENDMVEMLMLLQSLPGRVEQIDLLPYHTLGNNKCERFAMPNPMEGVQALTKNDLLPYVELFKNNGFKVTVGG